DGHVTGVQTCALPICQGWAADPLAIPFADEVENRRDLRGAPLGGASLPGVDLRHTNLDFASLASANLEGARFGGASLNYADLRRSEERRVGKGGEARR